MQILLGTIVLLATLSVFSLFSLKAPKGSLAMGGLANAAIASFLVEAIHKYIFGDFLGINFLGLTGQMAGSVGGIAAVILVSLSMKVNPIYCVAAGLAVADFGILPGFIAGYFIGLIGPYIEKKLPKGTNIIFGALLISPLSRGIAFVSQPLVDIVLNNVGSIIIGATESSPLVMGFILGGIMKMICTSPLSSMALTAMLGLTGLPMGIAAIACFGGSFTNGIVFKRLKLGNKDRIIGVMLEPLTQADIITANPIPIYMSNFVGGGLAGISAAYFNIINNAPGTASPIPGLLAPFAFNDPIIVFKALLFAFLGGCIAGVIGTSVYKFLKTKIKKMSYGGKHDIIKQI